MGSKKSGMTKAKAISLLEEWIEVDKKLLEGDEGSDYAQFVLLRDEALALALVAVKTPEKMRCKSCMKFKKRGLVGNGWCRKEASEPTMVYGGYVSCNDFELEVK